MSVSARLVSVTAVLVVFGATANAADERTLTPRVISTDDANEVKSVIDSVLFPPDIKNLVEECRQVSAANGVCQPLIPSRAVPVGFTFESGSAALSPQSKRVLDGIGEVLSSRQSYYANLMVEGHTDSTGSSARNVILSRERAESVRRYLSEAHGIKNINTKGWGSQFPLVADNPKAAANRRIEFRVQYP
jgi:outer membrane protein OmpA-like peptidoglycan-associated protein